MDQPQCEKTKAKPKKLKNRIKSKIFRHKTTDEKHEHKDQDTSNGIKINEKQVQRRFFNFLKVDYLYFAPTTV